MSISTRDRQGAAAARRAVLDSRDRFWRPADLGLAASTAHHLLGALVGERELRHVRRGLYWRGRRTPLGMAPPSPEALVAALVPGPGVGPAGLSAANVLRLSTQVPRRAEFAVPCRAPWDAGAVTFVSRAARTARATERLSPMEVAFLEVLEDWVRVVETEPSRAVARLRGLLRSGAVRPERLARAARTEPAPGRARLQALLNASGRPDLAERVPDSDPRTRAAALSSMALT